MVGGLRVAEHDALVYPRFRGALEGLGRTSEREEVARIDVGRDYAVYFRRQLNHGSLFGCNRADACSGTKKLTIVPVLRVTLPTLTECS